MKILIVSFTYPPEIGAAPSRISNMAEALCSRGNKVEVLTALPNYPKGKIFEGYRGKYSVVEMINNIKVHRYWTYASISKSPFSRILSMFALSSSIWSFAFKKNKIKDYDLVIIQSPTLPLASSAVTIFKKIYHKTVVINISDLWPLSAVELGAVKEGSKPYKVLAAMERYIYKNCDAIQGQSQEILDHVRTFHPNKETFLYRNLQHNYSEKLEENEKGTFKIVYAGLLGVAQDILSIIKQINFKELGTELHLYGAGNQTEEILSYLKKEDCGVVYHGSLSKQEMVKELKKYNASIVPLVVRIRGAVPSKIFDLMPMGVPILFCGGGEGAKIVENYKIGYTSQPGDYTALCDNITKMKNLSVQEFKNMKEACIKASKSDFSFENQMDRYVDFINKIVK